MLDPSIPINAGRPDPPNFTRTLGQMVQIRGASLENQQRQQQIVQTGQAMDERAQLKALLADPGDPETLFDRIDAISPTVGQAFRKSALEGQSAQINLGLAKAKRFGQIAGGIKPDDETSYHAGIASAFGEGLIDQQAAQKMLDMPPGPERNAAVAQVMQQALTTEQQLEERRKQLEDKRKAGAQPALDAKAAADLERVKLQNEALRNPQQVPTYRQDRETGALVRGIDVPANAKITQEPAPVRVSVGDASGASANVPKGVGGDDALAGLDENKKRTVKLIANYKAQLPTGAALRAPYWQDMLGLAAAYDPTFDATQYSTRQRLRIDMTSGKSSQNVKSFNTAIAHLDTLKNRAADLHNRSFTPWNTLANLASQKAGDSAVTNFLTAADAVAAEAATAFKGTAGTDREIKAWRQSLSSSMSPDQINGAINTISELLAGRIRETNSQYERGMGKPKDFHFLSDKSRKILGGLGVDVNDIDPAGAPKTEAAKDPLGIQ